MLFNVRIAAYFHANAVFQKTMRADIAQLAAIVAHAKASRLHPEVAGNQQYWSHHSTFKYVASIRFVTKDASLAGKETTMTSVSEWIGSIPPLKTQAILMTSGTAFTVNYITGPQNWSVTWSRASRFDPERPWSIEYSATRGSPGVEMDRPEVSVDGASAELDNTLSEVDVLSGSSRVLAEWQKIIQQARANLHSRTPEIAYHPDVLPRAGYSLASRQLLAAAFGGWVLGGMGSWNDLADAALPASANLKSVTKRLSKSLLQDIMTAINWGC